MHCECEFSPFRIQTLTLSHPCRCIGGTSSSNMSAPLLSATKLSPCTQSSSSVTMSLYYYCPLPIFWELLLSCTAAFLRFYSQPTFHQTAQNVAQTKHQHCLKGSNSVNLVLCVNSGPGTGFRMEYHYSENTHVNAQNFTLVPSKLRIHNELTHRGKENMKVGDVEEPGLLN